MIWIALAALAVIVVAILAWPLLRGNATAESRSDFDLMVFRDQLTEIDRDLSRGVLTHEEAAAARLEIQRRILAAGKALPEVRATDEKKWRIGTAAGVAVMVPVIGLAAYLSVGAPSLPGGSANDAARQQQDIARMVDQLAARVAAEPGNVQGLALLARTYRQLKRYEDSAETYRRLAALDPSADNYASLGEVIIAAAGGAVTADAHKAFMQALAIDRDEPRTRFYLGVERAQQGDGESAIAIWRDLLASAPSDASWIGLVQGEMNHVAQAANIAPASVAPKHPLDMADAGPTAAGPDVSALAGQMSAQNLEMIQGMVSGLAARLKDNPDDYDGWMRLGQSYTVLKNPTAAEATFEKAIMLRPKEIEPKIRLITLIMTATGLDGPEPLPSALTATAVDVLKLDPSQPQALFVSGLSSLKSGDKAKAKVDWEKAKAVLPEDAPLRKEIQRRLQSLD